MMDATRQGHTGVERLMLQHNAIADVSNKYEWTALHFAAQSGHLPLVKLFLDYDIDAQNQSV